MVNMMKHSLLVIALVSMLGMSARLWAGSASSETPPLCDRCAIILEQIEQRLSERCDAVPDQMALREQPIYLFLSIFDEIGLGIDRTMKARISGAALDGMQCDDLDAGVKAAQKMATKLMVEANS